MLRKALEIRKFGLVAASFFVDQAECYFGTKQPRSGDFFVRWTVLRIGALDSLENWSSDDGLAHKEIGTMREARTTSEDVVVGVPIDHSGCCIA